MRNGRRRWTQGGLCAVVLIAGCGGKEEKVAARVGKDIITEAEFYKRVQSMDAMTLGNLAQSGAPARAGEATMRAMILEKIVEQLAATKNISASETDIDQFLAFAKKYPNLPGSLPNNPYRADDLTRREAKTQLILSRLIAEPLKLKEEDLQKTYDRLKSQLQEPDQYRLRLIDSSTRAKSEEALTSLKSGVAFETVALTKSEDPSSKAKSGDIGMIPANQLPRELLAAVKKLKVGEYTKMVVEANLQMRNPATGQPSGQNIKRYFLAKLEEMKPARTPPLQEVRPLIQQQVIQEKDPGFAQRMGEQLQKFTKETDIQVNIKEYEPLVERLKNPPGAPGGAPTAPAPAR